MVVEILLVGVGCRVGGRHQTVNLDSERGVVGSIPTLPTRYNRTHRRI